jgi:hypothetical protein
MVACCLLVEADELGYGNEEKKKDWRRRGAQLLEHFAR